MQANEMKRLFLIKFDALFEFAAPNYSDEQISIILTNAERRVFLSQYNPFGNKYAAGFESTEQRRRFLEQLIKPASISATGVSGAISYTGNTTNTSKIITALNNVVGLNPGIPISGAGIPVSTIITKIISSTSIEISNAATATATGVTLTSGLGKSASQGGIHDNGVFLDLPEDFLYAEEEAGKLSGSTKEVKIKPVTHDEYLANIDNPYKKPYTGLLWRMDMSRIEHGDGETAKRTEIIVPTSTTLSSYRLRYVSYPPAIVVDENNEANQVHCIMDESVHEMIVDEAVLIAKAAVKGEEYQIGLSERQRSE